VEQVSNPWIIANRVEVGMDFEKLKDIGVFSVTFLERGEGLIGVVKPEIPIHKRAGRNIA